VQAELDRDDAGGGAAARVDPGDRRAALGHGRQLLVPDARRQGGRRVGPDVLRRPALSIFFFVGMFAAAMLMLFLSYGAMH